MRFLLIGPLPEPINGCSYANAVLLRRAREEGHDFRAIDTSTPTISGKQGARFSLRKALAFLGTYRHLPRVLRADAVYLTPGQTFFGLMKYAPFILLARWSRRPYVIHLHGNHLGRHYAELPGLRKRLFHGCVSHAAAGIVLSESLRGNFKNLLPGERVFVVENFAGDDLFTDTAAAGKPTDRLEILYLSNLMREKGILDLLDALAVLKREKVDFRARIAGHIEKGLEAEVRKRLDALMPEAVYVGAVAGDRKRRLLAGANVFALPTYYAMEGQPISLLEGLATGNIIVTTAHAGIPDIVDASHGHVIEARNPAALAATLRKISAHLPDEVDRFSRHNRDYAAARFTERSFAGRVVAVLRQAAERPAGETSRRTA
ncbi:glycosyltransferase family 4 protein [Xenophilus sp.]|jgi:glycosyltransferase involved in cell wall biosynthesis|uniref:glycosyltransferase family 4 protein n=1 Tax=Xenophilus sp. TaxID=1873499 RepID=UPI0037DD1F07